MASQAANSGHTQVVTQEVAELELGEAGVWEEMPAGEAVEKEYQQVQCMVSDGENRGGRPPGKLRHGRYVLAFIGRGAAVYRRNGL